MESSPFDMPTQYGPRYSASPCPPLRKVSCRRARPVPTAALEDYRASKSTNQAAQSTTGSGPSRQDKSGMKPMTLEEKMDAAMRNALELTAKAADTGDSLGNSAGAGASSNT